MIKKIIIKLFIFLIVIFLMAPLSQAQYYSEEGESISLDLKGVAIRDVLKILSQKSGRNIVADKDVEGTVTLYVRDVEVMEALDIIVLTNELAYEEKGSLVRVMTDKRYEKLYGKKTGNKTGKEIIKASEADTPCLTGSAFEDVKRSVGRIVSDEAANTIVLIDNLENVEKIFFALDATEEHKREKELKSHLDEWEKKKEDLKTQKPEEPKEKIVTPILDLKPEQPKKKKTQKAKRKKKDIPDKKTPYADYRLIIKKELDNNAKCQDVSGLKGKVELQFTLDEEGFVIRGPIVLNKPDLKLVRAAVNCVKKASPFAPFPRAMQKKEAEFYVVLMYE